METLELILSMIEDGDSAIFDNHYIELFKKAINELRDKQQSKAFMAFKESEEERREVYRRLADS